MTHYLAMFFYIWTLLFLLSIILMLFREQGILEFVEVIRTAIEPKVWVTVFLLIVTYFMMPFTIPYSIAYIIKRK